MTDRRDPAQPSQHGRAQQDTALCSGQQSQYRCGGWVQNSPQDVCHFSSLVRPSYTTSLCLLLRLPSACCRAREPPWNSRKVSGGVHRRPRQGQNFCKALPAGEDFLRLTGRCKRLSHCARLSTNKYSLPSSLSFPQVLDKEGGKLPTSLVETLWTIIQRMKASSAP